MHQYRDLLTALVRRWEFWLCGLATLPSVLALVIPDFPASLTMAMDVLLIVLLAVTIPGRGKGNEQASGKLDNRPQE